MSGNYIPKYIKLYPDALTVGEVAEILRVSTNTVYKLIRSGQISSVKIGRENRVSKSNLMKHIHKGNEADTNPGKIKTKKVR